MFLLTAVKVGLDGLGPFQQKLFYDWMERWMDGQMDRWTDGWSDGWMDGWMDKWIKFVVLLCSLTEVTASTFMSLGIFGELQGYKNCGRQLPFKANIKGTSYMVQLPGARQKCSLVRAHSLKNFKEA